MPQGMQWDRAAKREKVRRERADGPPGYDPDAPVRDDQMRRLRRLATDTNTDVPPRRELTQEQANDLIGYLVDVQQGRRS